VWQKILLDFFAAKISCRSFFIPIGKTMRIEDNSHRFELVLTDTRVDKSGKLITTKRSKTFRTGEDMYVWAQSERKAWAFELKHPIKNNKNKKKKS
jgi:hypothetical protein